MEAETEEMFLKTIAAGTHRALFEQSEFMKHSLVRHERGWGVAVALNVMKDRKEDHRILEANDLVILVVLKRRMAIDRHIK